MPRPWLSLPGRPLSADDTLRCGDAREGIVEISLELSRLVSVFGPNILHDVPRRFCGSLNSLSRDQLLRRLAASMPGYLGEIGQAIPLSRMVFQVDQSGEAAFVSGMTVAVNEVLLHAAHRALSLRLVAEEPAA